MRGEGCTIINSPFSSPDQRVIVCITHKTFHVCNGGDTCVPVQCPDEGYYCAKSKLSLCDIDPRTGDATDYNYFYNGRDYKPHLGGGDDDNDDNTEIAAGDGDDDGKPLRVKRKKVKNRRRRAKATTTTATNRQELLHVFMAKLKNSVDRSFTEKEILNMYAMLLHASLHFCKNVDSDTLANMMIYTLESTQTLRPDSVKNLFYKKGSVRSNRRLQTPHRMLRNYDLSRVLTKD